MTEDDMEVTKYVIKQQNHLRIIDEPAAFTQKSELGYRD